MMILNLYHIQIVYNYTVPSHYLGFLSCHSMTLCTMLQYKTSLAHHNTITTTGKFNSSLHRKIPGLKIQPT